MASTRRVQPTQTSGVSGPAYATAKPRPEPAGASSQAGGPSPAELRAAWDAYQGRFSGPLTPLEGQPDLNILTNRVGPMVRTGVDFLFGPVLKMQTSAGDAAQKVIEAAWGNEDMRMSTLARMRINGGVYGHVFAKIVPPKAGTASAENPPRIVILNPELMSVETDPDDCELVMCYCITYAATAVDGEPIQKRQTVRRIDPDGDDDTTATGEDTDTCWLIEDWVRADDTSDWQRVGEPQEWPYRFAPIVDWQNYPNPNDHWGARDIDDSVVNLNRNLHLIESNINSVQFSHGHPWLFSTGADTNGITPTPGVLTDLGSPDATVMAISASGDLANMMNFAAMVRQDMDEASGNPGVATGRITELPHGAISGITIRLLYGPRLMRTEHERRLYGQGIRHICRAVLGICGQAEAALEDIDLTWQDPLPSDDLAMAQMALALQQLGLSDHTLFAMIGQNWDTEQEYKKQEAATKMSAFAQGAGMPPVAPLPVGDDAADAASDDGQPPTGNGGGMPPLNHPAAIAARQKMQAAFGK